MTKDRWTMHRSLAAILAAASFLLVAANPTDAAAQGRPQPVAQPVVEVVDLFVESVELIEGELVANVLVTLDIVGREVEQLVQVPLTLSGLPGDGECDILRLELGPLDLDLLGLVVELDDCDDGPVIVNIDAIAGEGLLGDLLCGLAGGLLEGLNAGNLLGSLSDTELAAVTGAIRDVLNEVLADLLADGVENDNGNGGGQQGNRPPHAGNGRPPHAQGGQAADGDRCDILNLELGAINLELLGLVVTTSDICLDVYAESGEGNLLGNLLCSVVHLLDAPGNRFGQLLGLVQDINDLLDLLEL